MWKAISRLAASIMWHKGHRTEHEKEEAISEVSSHDKGQQRMVKQVVEVSEISKNAAIFFDVPESHMTEQLVEVPEVDIEVACPSSEAEPDAVTHSSAQSLGSVACWGWAARDMLQRVKEYDLSSACGLSPSGTVFGHVLADPDR